MVKAASVLTMMAISYPFVSHLGTMFSIPAAALLWLGLMLFGGWWAGSRSPILLSLAIACLAAAILGHVSHSADLMLRVPPVVICCSLAWLFGRTLFAGRTALVSRIGERMRGALPEPVARYGYRLTAIWTLFFILMGVESILLGLFASPLLWSVFTNFINYLLIALFFVLEYPVRLWALRDLEHTSFIDSLRGSIRMGLR
jgi:uncharacterized membrane protein